MKTLLRKGKFVENSVINVIVTRLHHISRALELKSE